MSRSRIIVWILIYGLIIMVGGYFMPKEIDWKPNYSKNFTTPYGCKVLFGEIGSLFSTSDIEENTKSLYQIDDIISDNSLLILIDDKIEMDSLDSQILLDAVLEGIQVLIAAHQFPSRILDSAGVIVQTNYVGKYIVNEGLKNDAVQHGFYSTELNEEPNFDLEVNGEVRFFENVDSIGSARGLAWVEDLDKPNFVYYNYGKGRILLHSNPLLFTNYHMLSDGGSRYLESIFSFISEPQFIFWDEYYKEVNGQVEAKPLKVLLAEPPLRWALYLSLCGILLILVFMSKRRQRIIPEANIFKNESKELVETIGDLYFNTSDNRSILLKKISLFKQDFSRKYKCFDLREITDKVFEIYVQKTGMDQQELKKLFKEIENVSISDSITDERLIQLNNQINRLILQ